MEKKSLFQEGFLRSCRGYAMRRNEPSINLRELSSDKTLNRGIHRWLKQRPGSDLQHHSRLEILVEREESSIVYVDLSRLRIGMIAFSIILGNNSAVFI